MRNPFSKKELEPEVQPEPESNEEGQTFNEFKAQSNNVRQASYSQILKSGYSDKIAFAAAYQAITLISRMVARCPLVVLNREGMLDNNPSLISALFSECGKPDGINSSYKWKQYLMTQLLSTGNVFVYFDGLRLHLCQLSGAKREGDMVVLQPLFSKDREVVEENEVVHISLPPVPYLQNTYDQKVTVMHENGEKAQGNNDTTYVQGYHLSLPPARYLQTLFGNAVLLDTMIRTVFARGILGDWVYAIDTDSAGNAEKMKKSFWIDNELKTDKAAVIGKNEKLTKEGDTLQQQGEGLSRMKRFITEEIARAYGVPARLLSVDTGQGAAEYAHVNEQFINTTLEGYMADISCALSGLVYPLEPSLENMSIQSENSLAFASGILRLGIAENFTKIMSTEKGQQLVSDSLLRKSLGLY